MYNAGARHSVATAYLRGKRLRPVRHKALKGWCARGTRIPDPVITNEERCLGEGDGFEMNRPQPALAIGKLGTRLPELVQWLRRKMHSPASIESNWSRPPNSPEQKHQQNPWDSGLNTQEVRAVPNLAGGESGIRTHGTVSRTHAFQACALSHSAISPEAPLMTGQGAFCKGGPASGQKFPQFFEIIKEIGSASGCRTCRFEPGGVPRRRLRRRQEPNQSGNGQR